MSTVCATPLLLGLIYLDVRYVKWIHIQPFHLENSWQHENVGFRQQKWNQNNKNSSKILQTSALLSAFFSKSRINFADFAGQRPCPFEWRFLACAVRPTPRQKRRNGMACLWAKTSSKYLLALTRGNFRIAKAVSLVFYIRRWNESKYIHIKKAITHQKQTEYYAKEPKMMS